jgi:hypothetical protein
VGECEWSDALLVDLFVQRSLDLVRLQLEDNKSAALVNARFTSEEHKKRGILPGASKRLDSLMVGYARVCVCVCVCVLSE